MKPRDGLRAGRVQERAAFWIRWVPVATCLAALLAYQWFTSVHVIPLTRIEANAIAGADLLWNPLPTSGPTISDDDLIHLAKDPAATKAIGFLDSRAGSPHLHLTDIQASRRITELLDRLISGRKLVVAVKQDNSAFETQSAVRELAKVYAIQLRLEAVERDRAGCFQLAMQALAYHRFLRRSPSSNIDGLFSAMAAESVIERSLEFAVQTGVFDPHQLLVLYRNIEPAPESDTELANALRADFTRSLDSFLLPLQHNAAAIDRLASIGYPNVIDDPALDDSEILRSGLAAGELNIPETVRREAEIYRSAVANCALPWNRQDRAALVKLEADVKLLPALPNISRSDPWLTRMCEKTLFKAKLRAIRNDLGLIVLSGSDIAGQAVSASFYHRTASEACRLAILIQLYSQLHGGALPGKLNDLSELVPTGHPPEDLYAGGPFHFDARRRIYWSVGENGVDDGGRNSPGVYPPLDIVWQLP